MSDSWGRRGWIWKPVFEVFGQQLCAVGRSAADWTRDSIFQHPLYQLVALEGSRLGRGNWTSSANDYSLVCGRGEVQLPRTVTRTYETRPTTSPAARSRTIAFRLARSVANLSTKTNSWLGNIYSPASLTVIMAGLEYYNALPSCLTARCQCLAGWIIHGSDLLPTCVISNGDSEAGDRGYQAAIYLDRRPRG